MKKIPVVIDCDPGVDDALALALALASPELEVLAITAVRGNVPAGAAFRNARRLVGWLGGHLPAARALPPVHPGGSRPLGKGRVDWKASAAIHGPEGLGRLFSGARRPPRPAGRPGEGAEEALLAHARAWGRRLTVVALGPLTNLARVHRRDPSALPGVGRIVLMGGAARMPGNVTPAAEFNVHCDPEAAEAVFASGARVTMVGLDVTRRAFLPSRMLAGGGSFRRALRDLTGIYAGFSLRRRGRDGVTLHDPLALAAAIRPGLLGCERLPVRVECGRGPARGMTVVDLRPEAPRGNVEVALDVDERGFLRFFLERLRSYHGWA
ncbi:MAG: nucleoside hydrolase [Candidatus Tectomicrobia bacterium]|uniref:Nucleoside hydrolase n=1 Tax=Tectimicrobiota bacterium TaxID=2528274 RepID=A0A932HVY7_UNCTE|nr:nucleoside hydrolase [Candidatus Tectomicrobia bacterium]